MPTHFGNMSDEELLSLAGRAGLGGRQTIPQRKFNPGDIQFTGGTFAGGQFSDRGADIDQKVEGEVLAQEGKEASKSLRTRRKAEALLLQSLLLQGKSANETQRQTGIPPGRISGLVSKFTRKFIGSNPEAQPFVGDTTETATGVAKIAAPSAKVGPDLINMFSGTVPTEGLTFIEARNTVINSIANGIFEEMSAAGVQIDVNAARAEATKTVDAFIAQNQDVFGSKSTLPQSEEVNLDEIFV